MADTQDDLTIIVNPDGSTTTTYPDGTVTETPATLGEADGTDSINYKQFEPKSPNPLKRLWIGKCTIYEYKTITDPKTFQSTQQLVPTLVDEPCRLSYRYEQATNIQNGAAVVSQSITLFIRPDLDIKAGSVIEITQHGRTTKFKGAGKPAVYTNHQELIMELYEDTV